jgi:5-methylcytosine-specific restriction enzyme A
MTTEPESIKIETIGITYPAGFVSLRDLLCGANLSHPSRQLRKMIFDAGGVPFIGATERKRLKKQFSEIKGTLFRQIRKKFPYCYYCNGYLYWDTASIDHKIPICRGGTNELNNLVIACDKCNKQKAWLTEDEYRQLFAST